MAPADVRGLAPVSEKLALAHGPIPAGLFEAGLRWLLETPDTERFFAVGWDQGAYRLAVPPQAGTSASLTYQPPAGAVAEFHSHGGHRAFFSATDDGDEQGFRIYGVVGRLDSPAPELALRLGIYATSPRWTGPRSSTARSRRDCGWRAKGPNQHQAT